MPSRANKLSRSAIQTPACRQVSDWSSVLILTEEPHPALEIIELRCDLRRDMALALADDAAQKAVVLGAPVRMGDIPDLGGVETRVRVNGVERAAGLGAAVLGHPLNAIIWLAGKLAAYGEALGAGDLVMTALVHAHGAVDPRRSGAGHVRRLGHGGGEHRGVAPHGRARAACGVSQGKSPAFFPPNPAGVRAKRVQPSLQYPPSRRRAYGPFTAPNDAEHKKWWR